MALEKITIATEEKQDLIIENISLIRADVSHLANKNDITEIEALIIDLHSQSLLQIKTGDNTKESNCKYLLIGVTTRDGTRIFDTLISTDTSGSSVTRSEYNKYITDKTTRMGDKTFYLLKETLIVTEFDMWGSESALMLKLD